jgi:hypothetical protein
MTEILEIVVAGTMTDRSGRHLTVLIIRIARRCAVENLIAFCHADQVGRIMAGRARDP